MIFTTSYKTGEGRHTATIHASSKKQAKKFIKLRNLNEKIIGWVKHDRSQPLPTSFHEKLHEATFLGFVGMRAGLLNIYEVLGDAGLVHEMAHALQFNQVERKEELFDITLQTWRQLIPGYLSKT